MSPTQILLTVSGFWVLSEIVIMRMKWAKASDATSHDRNSVYLFWACFAIGPFLAGMATGVVATRMAPPLRPWAFWGGLALIPIGIAIRWIAIATLKKYFTVNVAIAKDHRVIDHGIYGDAPDGSDFLVLGHENFGVVEEVGKGVKDWKPFGRESTFEDPATRWPDFNPAMPPRPSVVAIRRKGGGKIAT